MCWNALLLSMGSFLVCSNGLHLLICWELFAVCSYFMITLERDKREVRAAGWLYLAASHAGTLCLFAFFALLASRTGSWDLGPMNDRPELGWLFWLVLAGFGVKAGMFPLHIWLPSAHANAPSHVSAILSGVALKMGIYGILRFSGWLAVPSAAGCRVRSRTCGRGSSAAPVLATFAVRNAGSCVNSSDPPWKFRRNAMWQGGSGCVRKLRGFTPRRRRNGSSGPCAGSTISSSVSVIWRVVRRARAGMR
jgi:choline-glycine betaine transporter